MERAIVDELSVKASTTDELAHALEKHPPTVGRRCTDLAKRGVIRPLGTRLSDRGSPSSIWFLVGSLEPDRSGVQPSARRLPKKAKTRDLLIDGRVQIVIRTDSEVVAKVMGYHGTYRTECDARGVWRCTCLDGGRDCTHVAAVRLVTGFTR